MVGYGEIWNRYIGTIRDTGPRIRSVGKMSEYWFLVFSARDFGGSWSFQNCVTSLRPFDWLLQAREVGRPETEYSLINFWSIKKSRYDELLDEIGEG